MQISQVDLDTFPHQPWAVASASRDGPLDGPGTGWGPNLANKDLIMDILPHVGQRINSYISYCNAMVHHLVWIGLST